MRIFTSQIDTIKTEQNQSLSRLLSQLGVQTVNEHQHEQLEIERIDAVIVNGDADTSKVPYMVALAVAKQKPILCLLKKGEQIDASIEMLRKDKTISKKLVVSFYTPSTIQREIHSFLYKIEGVKSIKEVPSIKFTLRITPSMERYLQWKSKATGVSKADFLRKAIVDRIISKDEEYRNA